MGFSFVQAATVVGLEAIPIEVEADISKGLPRFHVVGLPDAATSEARERVRSAIKNSHLAFPRPVITVNLAPASIKKHGAAYDLPIALGILMADGTIPPAVLDGILVLGELSLDGRIRPAHGILPCVIMAKRESFRGVIVPEENAGEAALISGIEIYPVKTLAELVHALQDQKLEPLPKETRDAFLLIQERASAVTVDFADVAGQAHAKRALEIAAAGGHNILLLGSPGSGKTLLAKSVSGILPPLSFEEALEITAIHSVHGSLKKRPGVITRPAVSLASSQRKRHCACGRRE